MSSLSSVARKLVADAKSLRAEIDAFDDPPSRPQIEALQDTLNQLQRRLNRIQDRHLGGGERSCLMSRVINNTGQRRFELETSAGLAIADYRASGDSMTIFHTEVPVPLRGRGIGCRLVKGALEEVRELGLKVVPQCSFVREYIDRNPEFADLVR